MPDKSLLQKIAAPAIVILILVRFFSLYSIPLMDKTEARYAEIARIMAETGDFVTPQIDYGIPFWAKPPLSTWLSAICIQIFGANEFAVRLPYFLGSLLILLLLRKALRLEKNQFLLLCFICLTIPQFYLHMGVVSTDTMLQFSIVLALIAFWKSMQDDAHKLWGYLIFVGLGLGLLAKGPIIFILTLPPLFVWVVAFKKWSILFKKIPILFGIVLCCAIAFPWYYLAERKTPGFIDYFIVGEHFKRYLDSSWTGDKYGFAKTQPLGIVWVFLFISAFPWFQYVCYKMYMERKSIFKNEWFSFLLLWCFWTPLFFSISSSLIHTYTLPTMIPLALLSYDFIQKQTKKGKIISTSLVVPSLFVICFFLSLNSNLVKQYAKTDKYLVESIPKNTKILNLIRRNYSSQFYSEGKSTKIVELSLIEKIKKKEDFYVIVRDKNFKTLDSSLTKYLSPSASAYKSKVYTPVYNKASLNP